MILIHSIIHPSKELFEIIIRRITYILRDFRLLTLPASHGRQLGPLQTRQAYLFQVIDVAVLLSLPVVLLICNFLLFNHLFQLSDFFLDLRRLFNLIHFN